LRIVGAVLEQAQVYLAIGQADFTHLDTISQRQRREHTRFALLVQDRHEIEEHPASAGIAFQDDHRVLGTIAIQIARRVIVGGAHDDFGRGAGRSGFAVLSVYKLRFAGARPLRRVLGVAQLLERNFCSGAWAGR